VQHYRVYLIGSDGHIERAVDLQCDNEDQALAQARELAKDRAVELWQGGRQIAVIEQPS
jgi:hypothetical protein